MKITLYGKDEFPITYNTETNEKICIGFCNQCPLFCQYVETGNDNIDCDRIMLLDKGQVVAQGTHKQLMQNNKEYRKIYKTEESNKEGE